MTFANFSQDENNADLPTLKVLGWDYEDTELHLDNVHHELKAKLRWPADERISRSGAKHGHPLLSYVIRKSSQHPRPGYQASSVSPTNKGTCQASTWTGECQRRYAAIVRAFQETLIHDLKEDDLRICMRKPSLMVYLPPECHDPWASHQAILLTWFPIQTFSPRYPRYFYCNRRTAREDWFWWVRCSGNSRVIKQPDYTYGGYPRWLWQSYQARRPYNLFLWTFPYSIRQRQKDKRGVFYTPQPVVSYIVRSVHELLQKDFGLQDGLADITSWGEITARNRKT